MAERIGKEAAAAYAVRDARIDGYNDGYHAGKGGAS